MNNKILDIYINARAKVEGEIIALDGRIAALKEELATLEDLLTSYNEALDGKIEPQVEVLPAIAKLSRTEVTVAHFIESHPGSGRKDLRAGIKLNDAVVTNALSTLSKKKLIENRGTKARSEWFFVSN